METGICMSLEDRWQIRMNESIGLIGAKPITTGEIAELAARLMFFKIPLYTSKRREHSLKKTLPLSVRATPLKLASAQIPHIC